MKSRGEFQILTQKYWLLVERPFFKKTTLISFLKAKKSKKAYTQNDAHLPVYNSVKSVHLGFSHIVKMAVEVPIIPYEKNN